MTRLIGKTALVTGGAKGIGRGISRHYAREGCSVLVADVDTAAGEETAAGLAALGTPGIFLNTDVTSKADVVRAVQEVVQRFGRLDVLVNNAIKLSPNILLERKTDQMLEDLMRTGLWATWWAMQAAFPIMQGQGGGRIINLYSIDAEAGAWLRADYVAAKQAVLGLSRSAAAEWGRHNILVNCIAPAAAGSVFEEYARQDPGFVEMSARIKPMGRVGYPEADIAPVAAFLASDDARYITGEVLHVDGGLHLPRYNNKPSDLGA